MLQSLPKEQAQIFFGNYRQDIQELYDTLGDHQTNLVLDVVQGELKRIGLELKIRHRQIARPVSECATIFKNKLLTKSLSPKTIRDLYRLVEPQGISTNGALALNHLKVSFMPGSKLQWKAYLVYL